MDGLTRGELIQIQRAIEDCIDTSSKAIADYEFGISLGLVDDEKFIRKFIEWHKNRICILDSALRKIQIL